MAIIFTVPISAHARITFTDLWDQIKLLQQRVFQLQGQVNRVQETQAERVVQATPAFSFDSNLTLGNSGEAVKKLQEALTVEGVYDGPVTGYFGPLTKSGVARFQAKYADEILAPFQLTRGTGFFGPSTRKKLNALLAVKIVVETSGQTRTELVAAHVVKIKKYPLVTTTATPSGTTALSFDGINDYVDLGSDPSLNLGSDFEISLRVKTNDARNATIVGRVDSGGLYEQYWYLGISGDSPGRIEASLGDGEKFSQIYSTISVADGKWHLVVWKRKGDSQTIFIDSVNKTNVNYIDKMIGDVNPSAVVTLGGDRESDDYYFGGTLDNVTITIAGELRGKWDFEETSGNTALDSSANGNGGSIVGATRVGF